MFTGNRFHEHDLGANVLGDLLDLEFPEMGCLDLDLAAGDCNDTVLGRLNALADFLAFAHVNFHDRSSLPATARRYTGPLVRLWYTNWFTRAYTFAW